MVKKKVKKESESKCKPSTIIGIVGLFVLALLLLNLVDVGQGFITGAATTQAGQGLISRLFADWSAGNMDINIAKYLLFGILIVLIYSALAFAKFPPQPALQWLIAVPVAFLAIAYLTPTAILAILISYSGLGITISTIIPFVILLFFSAMLLSNEQLNKMSVGKILFQIVLWGVWVAYLLYRFVLLIFYEGDATKGVSFNLEMSFPTIVLLITLIAGIYILVKNEKFRKWIWGLGRSLINERAIVKETIIESQQNLANKVTSNIIIDPATGKPYGQ